MSDLLERLRAEDEEGVRRFTKGKMCAASRRPFRPVFQGADVAIPVGAVGG
jgi:hypothetical protein